MRRSSHSLLLVALLLTRCDQSSRPMDAATGDAMVERDGEADVAPDALDAAPVPTWCSLGSDVPGAVVPAGFCLRRFAQVNEPRTLLVAPNGDVFVGAPSSFTPGGANGGPGAVLVLADDDHDGTAEVHPFVRDVADVHGIALGGGSLYYTTQTDVFRVPYADGDRVASTPPVSLAAPASFSEGGRWTHGLARSMAGVLYASHAQAEACGAGTHSGSIDAIGPNGFETVSVGFRNPMYMRCHFRDEVCVASETGRDLESDARDKLLTVQAGTDFGMPCCVDPGVALASAPAGTSCAAVATEDVAMPVETTPFGMDWERGLWGAPYANGLFVALHGSFYSDPQWQGAGVVFWPTDPTTHRPMGRSTEFLGGWGSHADASVDPLRRPADVAFAPDGRMFVADDVGNAVYWVAPTTLALPPR